MSTFSRGIKCIAYALSVFIVLAFFSIVAIALVALIEQRTAHMTEFTWDMIAGISIGGTALALCLEILGKTRVIRINSKR